MSLQDLVTIFKLETMLNDLFPSQASPLKPPPHWIQGAMTVRDEYNHFQTLLTDIF